MREVKKEKRYFSPLAAISILCGLLGLYGLKDPKFIPMPQIVGLVAGFAGLLHMRMARGAVRGHGTATLGIVLCLISWIGVPIGQKAIEMSKEKQKSATCITHLMEITKAVRMYETETERLVPATTWCNALAQYIRDESYYACPSLPESRVGYFCNVGSNRETRQGPGVPPNLIVQFCDGSGAWNEYGGSEKVVYRHLGRANVLFMDGHTGSIAPGDTKVVWDPTAVPAQP